MNRLITIILVAVSLSHGVVQGVDFESLMTAGNSAYEQGEFEQAIAEYEKILNADGVSTALHYNLGCAYFNQKSYGKAILHFEKARQLSPRDVDVLHNLRFSKLFLKDRFELPESMPLVVWFNEFRQSFSLAELRLWELIMFSILILGIISYRLLQSRSAGRVILIATYVVGILFLLSAGWLGDRILSLEDQRAVLLVKKANVSSAPLVGSGTLFVIHEGTSAEILNTTDSWYEIRLPDGKTGWIMHEAVGIY